MQLRSGLLYVNISQRCRSVQYWSNVLPRRRARRVHTVWIQQKVLSLPVRNRSTAGWHSRDGARNISPSERGKPCAGRHSAELARPRPCHSSSREHPVRQRRYIWCLQLLYSACMCAYTVPGTVLAKKRPVSATSTTYGRGAPHVCEAPRLKSPPISRTL